MKKLLVILLGLLTMFCGTVVAQSSRYVELKMESKILGVTKDLAVYLPEGYDDSGKEYPVLYLLHGAHGTYKTWLNSGDMKNISDAAIKAGMSLPMVVVMPDASGDGTPQHRYGGWNMGYPNLDGWRYEDYFFEELIPYVEKNFRVSSDRERHAIAGLSMGGGGSVYYSMRHPDYFGSCCSLSGRLSMTEEERDERLPMTDKFHPAYTNSIYDNQSVKFFDTATEAQLEALKTVRWYIDCGDDDYLYEGNVMLYDLMKRNGIPVQYRMRDGAHTWEYWRSALPTVLTFVSVGFAM